VSAGKEAARTLLHSLGQPLSTFTRIQYFEGVRARKESKRKSVLEQIEHSCNYFLCI